MAETKLPIKSDDKTPAFPALPSLDELRREINHVFEDFGRGWQRPFRGLESLMNPRLTLPTVDIAEKDSTFELTAELPGIAVKDVDVSLRNGDLVIKGEKQEQKEEKSKDYFLKERQYGSFERRFPLPQGVDPSAIEARFQNGVLVVTMPKKPEAMTPARKIEVRSA